MTPSPTNPRTPTFDRQKSTPTLSTDQRTDGPPWPQAKLKRAHDRWPLVDKGYDQGGYLWILTRDKSTKALLKSELETIGGINFGREAQEYVPAYPSQGPIQAYDNPSREYTANQWKDHGECRLWQRSELQGREWLFVQRPISTLLPCHLS